VVIAAPKTPIPCRPARARRGTCTKRSEPGRRFDTRFAGSMWFVYLHIAWFSIWIALGVEYYPYGLLTMIVSLEAIFLSTFVMISQNRQDETRRHLAGQEWGTVQSEGQHKRRADRALQPDPGSDKDDPRADAGARARVGQSACGFKVRDDLLYLRLLPKGELDSRGLRFAMSPPRPWFGKPR